MCLDWNFDEIFEQILKSFVQILGGFYKKIELYQEISAI
jgi:hypothetical protein